MAKILDMNMVYQINQFLKAEQIGYSLHCDGACGGEISELRQEGEAMQSEAICEVINEFLKDKWMQVEPIKAGSYLLRVK